MKKKTNASTRSNIRSKQVWYLVFANILGNARKKNLKYLFRTAKNTVFPNLYEIVCAKNFKSLKSTVRRNTRNMHYQTTYFVNIATKQIRVSRETIPHYE